MGMDEKLRQRRQGLDAGELFQQTWPEIESVNPFVPLSTPLSRLSSSKFEAGIETARQLRLRNVEGVIVRNFIDMITGKDRINIVNPMRKELSKDRAKHFRLTMSQLGRMEISRQWHSHSNSSEMPVICKYHDGDECVRSL
jgi:Rne/Rng family ribonuclease